MARSRMKICILVTLLASMFFASNGIVHSVKSNPTLIIEDCRSTFEVAQSPQTFDFTVAAWDYVIVECNYSTMNPSTRFGYSISFTVDGGSLEFFICDSYEVGLWEVGSPIYVDSDKVWSSTSGVTTTHSYYANEALTFVFNNDHGDPLDVSGSILIDSEGPVITSSLVNNETVSGRTTVTASATDSFSGVESITLFIDGYQHEEVDGASLSFDWNTPGYDNGLHPISIVALDNNGLMTNMTFHVWVENAGFAFSGLGSIGLIVGGGLVLVVVYYLIKRSRSLKTDYG